MSWISVKDQLPQTDKYMNSGDDLIWHESELVLVYDTTAGIQTAVLDEYGMWENPHDGGEYHHVTHWMWLPEEPKEAQK